MNEGIILWLENWLLEFVYFIWKIKILKKAKKKKLSLLLTNLVSKLINNKISFIYILGVSF